MENINVFKSLLPSDALHAVQHSELERNMFSCAIRVQQDEAIAIFLADTMVKVASVGGGLDIDCSTNPVLPDTMLKIAAAG